MDQTRGLMTAVLYRSYYYLSDLTPYPVWKKQQPRQHVEQVPYQHFLKRMRIMFPELPLAISDNHQDPLQIIRIIILDLRPNLDPPPIDSMLLLANLDKIFEVSTQCLLDLHRVISILCSPD